MDSVKIGTGMNEGKPTAHNIKAFAANRKTPKKITAEYLHNAGLHYLQRFASGSAHFRRVMLRKIDRSCACHEDQDRESCLMLLDALIEKFLRSGLLDDQAYIRGSVSSLRRRGLSSRAIQARMAARGLSESAIKSALAENMGETGENDLHAALRFIRRKRIGAYATTTCDDTRALAALGRAGFDYETSRRALALCHEDAEILLIRR